MQREDALEDEDMRRIDSGRPFKAIVLLKGVDWEFGLVSEAFVRTRSQTIRILRTRA